MNDSILEKARRAGDAIGEAANEIRALSDIELVQLFAVTQQQAKVPAPKQTATRRPPPKGKKVPAKKARPAKASPKRAKPADPEQVSARFNEEIVPAALEAFASGSFLRSGPITKQLADRFGVSPFRVREVLKAMRKKSQLEATGTGPGLMYRATSGRQTRAKPARRAAPATADEEEGTPPAPQDDPVKLSLFAPMRPTLVPPARRAAPVIPCDPTPPARDRSEQSGVHRLPMLEAGEGERRDCAHEGECLKRYLKAQPKGVFGGGKGTRGEGPARCPAGCEHHTPHSAHARYAHATAFGNRPAPPI